MVCNSICWCCYGNTFATSQAHHAFCYDVHHLRTIFHCTGILLGVDFKVTIRLFCKCNVFEMYSRDISSPVKCLVYLQTCAKHCAFTYVNNTYFRSESWTKWWCTTDTMA